MTDGPGRASCAHRGLRAFRVQPGVVPMRRTSMTRISALVIAALAATGVAVVPAATTAVAASLPACHAADVALHYRATDSGAGHRYGRIVMKNTSTHACTSGGFGGLSYVGDGDGTQIGAAADREGTWHAFTLQPGQRAYSPVDEVVAQNYPKATCRPAAVDGFPEHPATTETD